MQVIEITVKMGMTQNLGDYTNCRPEIEMRVTISPDDIVPMALDHLIKDCQGRLHNIVDDELEAAGKPVKYHDGPLYGVCYAEKRRLVVIYPAGDKLPECGNWRESDVWRVDYTAPSKMRLDMAFRLAQKISSDRGFAALDCTDGDYSDLPQLPDPGPQPAWHQKGLESNLKFLQIKDADWESIASQEHVDATYLRRMYDRDLERMDYDERLKILVNNLSWEPTWERRTEISDDDDDDIGF